jgi:hypothetical protein
MERTEVELGTELEGFEALAEVLLVEVLLVEVLEAKTVTLKYMRLNIQGKCTLGHRL